ncbi:MAG: Gfo/Idh/MocA family oxidoreductase [Magnetococcales bacterium]|nr:Gfo/Idh/MocA family oxidoreductase [Magnetococcales bacterium]
MTLRAAVIGTGYLGRFHAQKYRNIPGVDLVAVADLDPERGQQVGETLQVPYVQDFRNILDQVDLVSIAVPTLAHFSVAETCLKAGIHVLLEKPMTTTLAEADALIRLADQTRCLIQVGHLKRFHPAVMALRQSGRLRPCRYITSQRLAPFKNRALDVDVVLDLMIHDVDLILDFVGAEVTGIEADGQALVTRHIDLAQAHLQFANGATAHVMASRVSPTATRCMQILQDDACISLDFISKNVHIARRRPPAELLDEKSGEAVVAEPLSFQDHDTLEAEIRAFCNAVRLKQPPLVSGREGRKALQVVMAIRERILAKTTADGHR